MIKIIYIEGYLVMYFSNAKIVHRYLITAAVVLTMHASSMPDMNPTLHRAPSKLIYLAHVSRSDHARISPRSPSRRQKHSIIFPRRKPHHLRPHVENGQHILQERLP